MNRYYNNTEFNKTGYNIQKTSHPDFHWAIRYYENGCELTICFMKTRKMARFIKSQLIKDPYKVINYDPINNMRKIKIEELNINLP